MFFAWAAQVCGAWIYRQCEIGYNGFEVSGMDCAKIGALIRRLRLEQGLTQRALADRLGLSGKTISKWENGVSQS